MKPNELFFHFDTGDDDANASNIKACAMMIRCLNEVGVPYKLTMEPGSILMTVSNGY